MPELPEVETVVRDLRPLLIGRRVLGVRAGRRRLRRPWSRSWGPLLTGLRVESIARRGKWIVVHLERERVLVVHLGMTGQFTIVPQSTPPEEHVHLTFSLEHGGELRFRDIRRFGSVTLFSSRVAVESFFAKAGLGPDALVARNWGDRLLATRRCLKAVLLDQRIVAGVGNIYADEALFEARLHPARPADSLNRSEVARLNESVVTVLERAIDRRGSTIRDYVGGSGLRGGYQEEFRVYGRTGQPCPCCQTGIARLRLAGRSTHYCPECQPEGTGGVNGNGVAASG